MAEEQTEITEEAITTDDNDVTSNVTSETTGENISSDGNNTADEEDSMAETETTTNIHDVSVVYAKVDGANDEITAAAKAAETAKVRVTTKTFEREENHCNY